MQAERFRQIRNLFDAALERDESSRNVFLREACQGDEALLMEVGKLLAAHGEPTSWIDEGLLGQDVPRLEGRRIGAYEILRQLGEGGMGSVYLAARADGAYRKTVALKIVRPASATTEVLRRFQREREILASLDHPNIARITDGGTTDEGLPYLVMDYVEGEPIDVYCDRHRLDLSARLKLFRDVCSAVQYAHERHVIHRDVKPANILVTHDGVVKLLDFGIAKLSGSEVDGTTGLTRSDRCLMTPEYASPEQVSGGLITPASDIYSLAVVLYGLLTGRKPYRLRSRIIHEVVRVIAEEPPSRPSTAIMERGEDPANSADAISRVRASSPIELKRQLSGDLDCILLRGLEKDPPRRYRSAASFSEDIRKHLEGLSVDARRGMFADSAQKFVGRYLWLLIGSAAAALGVYDGVLRLDIALFGIWTAWLATAAFAASHHIFGKGFTGHKVPRVAQGLTVVFLLLAVAVSFLPRSLPFGVLALLGWNAWIFGRMVLWFRRGRRLGPILQDLTTRIRTQWRFRVRPTTWILVPLIVLSGYFAFLMSWLGLWFVASMAMGGTAILCLYLWIDSEPSKSIGRSALGTALPAALMLWCFAFVTYLFLQIPADFRWQGLQPLPVRILLRVSGLALLPGPLQLVFFYLLFLWMLPRLFISGRNEVRERGLAWSGRLIPWTDVLSYSWAQDTGLVEVLCLRIGRGSRSSRDIRIPMLSTHRSSVDGILRKQLSEWPV